MVLSMPGETTSSPVYIHGRVCPVCGRDHSVFMRRKHFFILFLFFFAHSERRSGPMCTRCVRYDILRRSLVEFFSANFLWPFFFFFSEVPQYVFSLLKDWAVRRGRLDPMAMEQEVSRSNSKLGFWGVAAAALAGIGSFAIVVFLFILLSRIPEDLLPDPYRFWSGFGILYLLLVLGFLLEKRRNSP